MEATAVVAAAAPAPARTNRTITDNKKTESSVFLFAWRGLNRPYEAGYLPRK